MVTRATRTAGRSRPDLPGRPDAPDRAAMPVDVRAWAGMGGALDMAFLLVSVLTDGTHDPSSPTVRQTARRWTDRAERRSYAEAGTKVKQSRDHHLSFGASLFGIASSALRTCVRKNGPGLGDSN